MLCNVPKHDELFEIIEDVLRKRNPKSKSLKAIGSKTEDKIKLDAINHWDTFPNSTSGITSDFSSL